MAEERHRSDVDLVGRHQSFWIATTGETSYPPLMGNVAVDVAVVGGGIVGLTTALMLKEAGRTVAVVEAGRVVKGVSGHTTAKITSQHTLIYKYLVSRFGREKAKQYADANQAAIEKIAGLVQDKNISCDFIRGPAYTYAETDEQRKQVEDEVQAARDLGLPASYEASIPLPVQAMGAVRFDNQARFHARKYLLALASMLPGNGSYIFENSRVTSLKEGVPNHLTAAGGTVLAGDVVIATHYPIFDKTGFYFARLEPSRSYVIGARVSEMFPEGMFVGVSDTSLSFREQVVEGGRIIIITDSAHPTGQETNTLARFHKLEERARTVFNSLKTEYWWSTQDYFSVDRIPYIGKLTAAQPHLFVATGFMKWGMTNGTAAAMLISDLIQGKQNPWTDVYNPSRFDPVASGKTFIEHNMSVIGRFMGDRIGLPAKKLGELSPGEGALVNDSGKQVGAYKDPDGKITRVNPVCQHMACVVHWNNAEKSWDCPCHGSRYDYEGKVLNAPTVKDLKKLE